MNNVKVLTEKMVKNCKKIDETILAVKNDVRNLKKERNCLKEEVENLREEVSRIDQEMSMGNRQVTSSKRNFEKKFQESVLLLSEIEELNWKYTWHKVIAENQTAELQENFERMKKLAFNKDNIENKDAVEDEIIYQLISENKAIEKEINSLQTSTPSEDDIVNIKQQILELKERNKNILSRLKQQLTYVENYHLQTKIYLENLENQSKY